MIPNPALLNRSRIQIQNEQIFALYRRLYWYMMQDFRHIQDCSACHIALSSAVGGFMTVAAEHGHEFLETPSVTLATAGIIASTAVEGTTALVPPLPGAQALKFVIFGGGLDDHSTAVLAENLGIGGNAINPSPAYVFTVRNVFGLVPDPAGTAVVDIAAGMQAATGEAGQPFTADTIATVIKPLVS
jgi:hypothetical protein